MFVELVDIVGQQATKEIADGAATEIDNRHVTDVKHTRVAPDSMMFFDLATVVNRHIPTAERHRAGTHVTMGLVEESLVCHAGLRVVADQIYRHKKSGTAIVAHESHAAPLSFNLRV